MNAEAVLDTNIWVYAVSSAPAEHDKKIKAIRLIAMPRSGLSAQVLQEFFVTVTRKIQQPLAREVALQWVERMAQLPCLPIDPGLVRRAIEFINRHQISYWDGAILAAAQMLGASTVYSEDLNHGQTYDGVRVVNPFVP